MSGTNAILRKLAYKILLVCFSRIRVVVVYVHEAHQNCSTPLNFLIKFNYPIPLTMTSNNNKRDVSLITRTPPRLARVTRASKAINVSENGEGEYSERILRSRPKLKFDGAHVLLR